MCSYKMEHACNNYLFIIIITNNCSYGGMIDYVLDLKLIDLKQSFINNNNVKT